MDVNEDGTAFRGDNSAYLAFYLALGISAISMLALGGAIIYNLAWIAIHFFWG